MKKILLFIIILFLSVCFSANPFNAEKEQNNDAEIKKGIASYSTVALRNLSQMQLKLRNRISRLTRKIKKEKSVKLIGTIILIAFFYGLIHAIGPGHGKTITATYFLSRSSNIRTSILFANALTFMHSISAIFVVFTVNVILRSTYSKSFAGIETISKKISYILIILIGIYILVKSILNLINHKDRKEQALREDLRTSLAIGLIPCPGTTIILLFFMSLKLFWLGMLVILFLTLGMAVTLSVVGIVSILFRERILNILEGTKFNIELTSHILEIIGAAFIIILGTLLFLTVF